MSTDPEHADEVLFRQVYPSVRAFAAVYAPAWLDPDDLVQEAVTRTLTRRRLSDLDDPGAYLRTAVANLVRNETTRTKGTSGRSIEEVSHDYYPSDLVDLGRIPPESRGALLLLDVERMSYSDAASILGCSVAALKVRIKRARRQLRRLNP